MALCIMRENLVWKKQCIVCIKVYQHFSYLSSEAFTSVTNEKPSFLSANIHPYPFFLLSHEDYTKTFTMSHKLKF